MKKISYVLLMLVLLFGSAYAEDIPGAEQKEQYYEMVQMVKGKRIIIETDWEKCEIVESADEPGLTLAKFVPIKGMEYVAVYEGDKYTGTYIVIEHETYAYNKYSSLFPVFLQTHDPETSEYIDALETASYLVSGLEVTKSTPISEEQKSELVRETGKVSMTLFVTAIIPSKVTLYYEPL